MTENELRSLKDLPVPAPRAEAKEAALKTARDAFDAGEEFEKPTQENDPTVRPISASHGAMRRTFMSLTRNQLALAASIAALIVAAPVAFHFSTSGLNGLDTFRTADREPLKSEGETTEIARLDDRQNGPLGMFTLPKDRDANEVRHAGTKTGADQKPDASNDDKRIAAIQKPAKPKATKAPSPIVSMNGGASGGRAVPGTAQVASAPPPPSPAPAEVDGLGAIGGYADSGQGTVATAPSSSVGTMGGANMRIAQRAGRLKKKRAQLALRAQKQEMNRAAPGYRPHVVKSAEEQKRILLEQQHRDQFEAVKQNTVKQVATEPVSTFSIDVDTASYSFVRRALNSGRLPPKDAVRVEEMINYFPYAYPKPETAEQPFQPTVTVLPSPWNSANQLVHVGIKGYDITATQRPRANLVFLMDVSGSMRSQDKLPLVKNAFKMLVNELKPDDTIGIVTYASGSGVLLEPTKIADKSKILAAIDRLGAGGSTAGAQGIQDAYRLAESNFDTNAVNRIILATDGDFNVGVTNRDELKGLIERKRKKGVFLSILGVGQGNYNDALMQTLAQNGNGTAAYVDTLNEARKVLVDEASSTLFTIAKDVKIQIEWNPTRVSEYRLIGYETRALNREDFNNDKVDAGDIGSGHTVTAIYEITPKGAPTLVDDLRYGKPKAVAADVQPAPAIADGKEGELGFLKLRYKLPKENTSTLISLTIAALGQPTSIEQAPAETRFSVAVAAFGQLIKGSPYTKSYSYDDVIALAQSAKGNDPFGYRAEFINLVRLAKSATP